MLRRFWYTARMKRSLFSRLGPGLITGASDDDPAGIVTYTQAGAQFGFATLWLAILATPLMIAVQEASARIALTTRKGFFTLAKQILPRILIYPLLVAFLFANVFNVAADLNMMADATRLLIPGNRWIWLTLFAIATFIAQLKLSYVQYSRVLRWLVLSLIGYVGVLAFVDIAWREVVLATFVPQGVPSREFILLVVAVLGTTLSPYLMIWQGEEELEERTTCEIEAAQRGGICRVRFDRALPSLRFDVAVGMIVSNVVFWCIVVASASTLHAQGITQIETAEQAANVLRPFVGSTATTLFTLGILGTGLLTIPVLIGSASYALAECCGWKASLHAKYHEAKAFYWSLGIMIAIALLMNVMALPPVRMLIWSGVINAFLAPAFMLILLVLGNRATLLKKQVHGRWSNAGLGVAFGLMSCALGALIWAYYL